MSSSAAAGRPGDHHRFVVLVDMDCFYCQVEEKLQPELCGQPVAVVQYTEWNGGGAIIAVNYAARAAGVTRHMRSAEATQTCPNIRLVLVPSAHGKADLGRYREAGKEVAAVLQTFTPLVERASVDEAYMDITRNVRERCQQMGRGDFVIEPHMLNSTYPHGYDSIGTFVQHVSKLTQQNDDGDSDASDDDDDAGCANNDVRLLIAATIATEIRAAVKQRTGYNCSAGIAHNKILAKLMCGQNKPNKQTLLPVDRVPLLYETLPVSAIRGLGGKFGDEVAERLKVTTMAQLARWQLAELQRHFDEKNAVFLYNIARGHDAEPVKVRMVAQNIGSSKRFRGMAAIKGLATLRHWLGVLAVEICERIEQYVAENQRRPTSLTVSFAQANNTGAMGKKGEVSSSRTVPLTERAQADAEQLAADALDVIRRNTEVFFRPGQAPAGEPPSVLNNPILLLGISVGKFQAVGGDGDGAANRIRSMFSVQADKQQQKERLNADGGRKSDVMPNDDGDLDGGALDESGASVTDGATESFLDRTSADETIATKASTGITAFFAKKRKSEHLLPEDDSTAKAVDPELDPAYLEDTLEEPPDQEPANLTNVPVNVASTTEITAFFAAKPKTPADQDKPQKEGFFARRLSAQAIVPVVKLDASHVVATVNEPPDDPSPPQPANKTPTGNQIKPQQEGFFVKRLSAQAISPILGTAAEPPDDGQPAQYPIQMPAKPAYMSEYAEFQAPQSTPVPHFDQQRLAVSPTNMTTPDVISPATSPGPPPVIFERCSTCNKKVPLHDVQSHADAHFAYQLSLEQRIEYRSQIVANTTVVASPAKSASKPPPAKRAKTNAASAVNVRSPKRNDGTSLLRFLAKASTAFGPESGAPDTEDTAGDRVTCTECGQRVPTAESQEHADYHAARRLQREWNASVSNASPAVTSTRSVAGRKAVASRTPAGAAAKLKKVPSVARFFTQQQ